MILQEALKYQGRVIIIINYGSHEILNHMQMLLFHVNSCDHSWLNGSNISLSFFQRLKPHKRQPWQRELHIIDFSILFVILVMFAFIMSIAHSEKDLVYSISCVC